MHTSRTGPTIKINTARTSSETHRANIQTNIYNKPLEFNTINRQSQEKSPILIHSNNNSVHSIDQTLKN